VHCDPVQAAVLRTAKVAVVWFVSVLFVSSGSSKLFSHIAFNALTRIPLPPQAMAAHSILLEATRASSAFAFSAQGHTASPDSHTTRSNSQCAAFPIETHHSPLFVRQAEHRGPLESSFINTEGVRRERRNAKGARSSQRICGAQNGDSRGSALSSSCSAGSLADVFVELKKKNEVGLPLHLLMFIRQPLQTLAFSHRPPGWTHLKRTSL
jgi:hypothetical protein